MRSPAKAPAVIVSRELPAPPARVFDWLTDPAKLALWLSPQGRVTAQAEARPGGRLLIVMWDGETPLEHRGEYLEVVPPRRLVFTWNSPYTDGDSLVTIELQPQGDKTLLTLRHERLPQQQAPTHAGGWGRIFDRLVAELVAEAGEDGA